MEPVVPFGSIGRVWSFRDVTSARQATTAMQREHDLLTAIIESTGEAVFAKDLDGRYTFANESYCRWVGRMQEAVEGKVDFDLFPALEAERIRADDREVARTGRVSVRIEEHQGRWVRVVKSPIRDECGKILGTQALFWDVTEQVRLDRRLEIQHAVTRVLAESAGLRGVTRSTSSRP